MPEFRIGAIDTDFSTDERERIDFCFLQTTTTPQVDTRDYVPSRTLTATDTIVYLAPAFRLVVIVEIHRMY